MIILESIFKELKKEKIYIIKFTKLSQGFNCNALQLIDKENKKYFLKIFLNNFLNKHKRLKSELSFINFLTENNLGNIPHVVFFNRKKNWILYDWVNGKKIDKIDKSDAQGLIDFLYKININKFRDNLPNASEACFSILEHKQLINSKIENSISKLMLIKNIDNNLIFQAINALKKKQYLLENIFAEQSLLNKKIIEEKLERHQKCLSPSDIGFHNILNSEGKLIFLDFEYAGIDDPFKLIADIILQPDHGMPENYIYLLKKLINLIKSDIPHFERKLKIILEFYKVKWFCIIFNPLIKENNIENMNAEIKKRISKSSEYFIRIEKKKIELLKII
tara:strand:+ start:193 stop:1197 length:1005 start_codon:yes stop_codon:yes gene_type:complete